MEEEVDKGMIASEYALIKKQLRKKERQLKKMNKVLQAKEHVRKTLEVYTKKKSPYKDPKVADAVKFKEGSPEVMKFEEGSPEDIPLVNSPVNNINAELKTECQIMLENKSVSSRIHVLPKNMRDFPLPSQDLFAPTLAPVTLAPVLSNFCTDIDSTTMTSETSLTNETPLTSETSIPVHLNEDFKTSPLNASVYDNDLLNDSFTDFDFHTIPLISESQNTSELYNDDARTETNQSIISESQELSNENFVSQNINIVRKGKSRKRTSKSSQDSLISNERNKRPKNRSTHKTNSNENIKNFNRYGFLNYRESSINNSLDTNNSSENVTSKDFDDYSNSLGAFAIDFDEMQIESNSVISSEDDSEYDSEDDSEDETISLAAEKAESNLETMQKNNKDLDPVNAKVYNDLIKDSKFSLSENKKKLDNSFNEISEEFNEKVTGDETLKTSGNKEFYEKEEIQCHKFPILESQGKILICAINVHNLNTSEIDKVIKRSIPTVLVIQEFGISLWQCCPKTDKLNKQPKDHFQKSWREIGRSNYNFGKSSDIKHIVANGLPSVENDVRFYVITKKANECGGNFIYIQVSSCAQFSRSDVVVTESVIPISSVCKGLYSSVLTEWSIAIYYTLQLKNEVAGVTAVNESTSTSNHISKALHVEFDLTYLMRKRRWKLDHQTTPLDNIGNLTSMVPLSHKDMNGLLLLANSESQLEVYDVEVDGVLKQISCPVDTTKCLRWAAVIKEIIIFMISYKNTVELWSIDTNAGSVEEIFSSNLEISHNIAGNFKSNALMVNAVTYVNKNFFAVSNCGTVWSIPITTR